MKHSIAYIIERVIEVDADTEAEALAAAPKAVRTDLADTDPDRIVEAARYEILSKEA